MKNAAIVAMVAVGSSLALYAGITQMPSNAKIAQTECCEQTDCCPTGGSEDCCAIGCD